MPDSVTSWNVFVHAVTRDWKAGSVKKEAKSVKDLMVRPYVPRFLREGDRADLKIVVNNASDKALSGRIAIDILDPETNASVLAAFGVAPEKASLPFTAAAGRGTNVTVSLAAPKRVGLYAFKVTAVSGDTSDGELRPVPLLPGRVHLVQSRFATLHDRDRREMTFADLARDDDPTRVNDQMVVTVDAQLFDSVLQALPYLVNYPYECTEQTLNRFVSTGIVSVALPRLSGRREDGRGTCETRHAPGDLGLGRRQPQDGARGDALARDGEGRARHGTSALPACSTRASPRRNGRRRWRSCARRRPSRAASRGGRAARLPPT